MSIAIAYFAIGATLATVALVHFVPEAPYERVVVLLSGGWAMVPDIGKLGLPVDDRMAVLADSVWANVFWFHERIDVIDAGNSLSFPAAKVRAFILVPFVAGRWDYAVAEQLAADEPVVPGRSLRSSGCFLESLVFFLLDCWWWGRWSSSRWRFSTLGLLPGWASRGCRRRGRAGGR